MDKKLKVVNIIPTYNEKENIGIMLEALAKIAQKHTQYEFLHLVADDSSPDGTAEVVRRYQKKNKDIHLISGPKKGLGEALLRSYQYAVEKLGAEVIIPNDADLSFDPKHIPELLEKIDQGYDVVVASRHVGKGGTEGWSLFRKLNHLVANVLFATYVAGIKEVKDHNGNFKAIRVKGVLDQVDFDKLRRKLKIRGFVIQTFILYELSKYTKKFTEIPVIFKFRTRGETKIGKKYLKSYLRDVFEYMKLCVLIRLERNQQFFRFAIVGTIGYVINAVSLQLFAEVWRWPEWLSWLVATELSIINNFALNNLWTFRRLQIRGVGKILLKFFHFNLTSAGALVIMTTAGTLGVKALGPQWRQILLPFIILFLVVPYNYFMYTTFIWKTRKGKAESQKKSV